MAWNVGQVSLERSERIFSNVSNSHHDIEVRVLWLRNAHFFGVGDFFVVASQIVRVEPLSFSKTVMLVLVPRVTHEHLRLFLVEVPKISFQASSPNPTRTEKVNTVPTQTQPGTSEIGYISALLPEATILRILLLIPCLIAFNNRHTLYFDLKYQFLRR